MGQGRGGVLQAGEHPGELAVPRLPLDLRQARRGHRLAGANDQVPIGECRHLGQVGDDQHLRRPAQSSQSAPHLDGRLAAHPRVYLVEDEGGDRVGGREHDLEGKHDPRSLAP